MNMRRATSMHVQVGVVMVASDMVMATPQSRGHQDLNIEKIIGCGIARAVQNPSNVWIEHAGL